MGIEEIYYIDPYPGISTSHILNFGKDGNPVVHLYYGAIGDAYMKLYTPRLPIKDELKLRTGIDSKKIVRNLSKDMERPQRVKKYRYIELQSYLTFNSRTDITEYSKMTVEVLENKMESIGNSIIWTGSSFDGFELKTCERNHKFENLTDGQSTHSYRLIFKTPLNCGERIEWEVLAKMKDTRRIMVPYYAQGITADMEHLYISLCAPKGLLREVKKVVYADTMMTKELEVLRESILPESNETTEEFVFDIPKPNLMYGYAIEWIFGELN